MRAVLAALLLAACTTAVGELNALDRLTLERVRGAGDDPTVVRPVEHDLLPGVEADPDGLEAALAEAGFEAFDVRSVRGQETSVVFRSDARDRTIARQVGWLRANAPLFGFNPVGWTTAPRPAA